MTPNECRRIKKVVRRLVQAEVDYSWMGSKDPEQFESIIKEVKTAREAFSILVESPDPPAHIAIVWHEGRKSFYRAILLESLTNEQALGPEDGNPVSPDPP